ncbi:hypothetical protein P154DRAFT_425561 [Amniculicola lignicola CBS 123094]|uniref:Mid2 domain-containing protein n=1 Tax=Amniculicola lignicola CBS 123094 TaxID=1392246 RepID=A0A6A5WT27_9PLEO|nr:hypothetical protein P154DRAFT_425561 [Amniculicola lignicola CBS 123094]
MRRSWALFALLFFVALTSALDLSAFNIDGIEAYLHHGEKRQASGTGSAQESTPSTPAPSSTPAPDSSSEETPTSTPTPASETPSSETPSATPTPDPSSETPAPSSSARQTSAPVTSNTPSSSPGATKTSKTPVVHSTPLVSTTVENFLTVYTTVSNGQQVEITSSTSRTVLHTTGQALSTEAASLPNPGNGGGGSGLSGSNKKIIGGVVGGVGGAILLGGLAIVCWRIWGRKKRVSEDDDDLMAGTGSALGDKSSGSPNTPFQSNLEQYHNPGGRPNAAANF